MQFILEFLENFWTLSLMLGFYVILGLVFVAVAHFYISSEWIKKHLNGKSSAIKGAIYGIPLPLCSCGVIPLALSLKEKGASKKAVTSFFITTPMTGVDSIIATYGVFGLPMAVLRVISSFLSGIIAGGFVKDDKEQSKSKTTTTCSCNCCGEKEEKVTVKGAIDYTLNNIFKDLAKPMFYGLTIATIFVIFLPEGGVNFLSENLFVSYALVLLVALPLYVCSISAIPIALSMLLLGVSSGGAFLFLAAAPATNIITAGVVKRFLGTDVLIIYLCSIIAITLSFALMIDFVLPSDWFTFASDSIHVESYSLLDKFSGVVFLALTISYMFKREK